MNTYTEVFIDADDRGRLQIGVRDDNGAGHGYRLAGPKYCVCCPGRTTSRRVLNKADVEEIRSYLAKWDEIQARSVVAVTR